MTGTGHERISGLDRSVAALRRFCSDCSGSTAIEYVLIGTFIAAAVIALAQVVSGGISDLSADIAEVLNGS